MEQFKFKSLFLFALGQACEHEPRGSKKNQASGFQKQFLVLNQVRHEAPVIFRATDKVQRQSQIWKL